MQSASANLGLSLEQATFLIIVVAYALYALFEIVVVPHLPREVVQRLHNETPLGKTRVGE